MRKDIFVQKLIEEYYESLYKFARAICQDEKLTAEIVGEVLEAAYLKADELQKCPNISGWLYRGVRYQLLKKTDTAQIPDLGEERVALDQYKEEYDRAILSEKRKSGGLFGKRKALEQKTDRLSAKSKLLGLIRKFKNS